MPHSGTQGSRDARSSPWTFAACRALLRRAAPRHPPWTCSRLAILPLPRAPSSRLAEGLLRFLFVFPSLVVSKNARPKKAPLLEIRGFEPLTPGLQSRCSSQLSYIPFSFGEAPSPGTLKKRDWGRKRIRGGSGCTPAGCLSLRKEVIQPHLPVRLPCYDFTPLTKRAFDSAPLAVGLPASGALHSDGVTGGVYKARERIHRAVLMRDY